MLSQVLVDSVTKRETIKKATSNYILASVTVWQKKPNFRVYSFCKSLHLNWYNFRASALRAPCVTVLYDSCRRRNSGDRKKQRSGGRSRLVAANPVGSYESKRRSNSTISKSAFLLRQEQLTWKALSLGWIAMGDNRWIVVLSITRRIRRKYAPSEEYVTCCRDFGQTPKASLR
jgi:hypothetical protein